jgi:hypothetical protein
MNNGQLILVVFIVLSAMTAILWRVDEHKRQRNKREGLNCWTVRCCKCHKPFTEWHGLEEESPLTYRLFCDCEWDEECVHGYCDRCYAEELLPKGESDA